MGVCLFVCLFCCTLLYVHSSFAIILMGRREVVAFLVCLPDVSLLLAPPRGAMGPSAICDFGIS